MGYKIQQSNQVTSFPAEICLSTASANDVIKLGVLVYIECFGQ